MLASAKPRAHHPYAVMPVAAYAMAAARHMHQYGTTREQLAAERLILALPL